MGSLRYLATVNGPNPEAISHSVMCKFCFPTFSDIFTLSLISAIGECVLSFAHASPPLITRKGQDLVWNIYPTTQRKPKGNYVRSLYRSGVFEACDARMHIFPCFVHNCN